MKKLLMGLMVAGVAVLVGLGARSGGAGVTSRAPTRPGPASVASSFARAWWQYEWRGGSASWLAGLRPWVTPTLLRVWHASPGAPIWDGTRQDARQSDQVSEVTVVAADRAPGMVGEALSALVVERAPGAQPLATRQEVEVEVATGAWPGWRVAEVSV